MRTVLLFTLLSLVALTGPARADRKFHGVPAAKGVQLRVVEYNGATNGALTVELRNRGKTAVSFTAQGLYFVPDGDPDKAPQRLGAVGPFQVEGEEDRREVLEIAAGQTVTVTLDVFCIDSHRSSPSSKTPFTVATKRMPKTLARDIDRGAREAAAEEGGFAAPSAKPKVQGAVWKNRDKKWVKLDGEGDQEADK